MRATAHLDKDLNRMSYFDRRAWRDADDRQDRKELADLAFMKAPEGPAP
jgi:hypothetical protein